MIVHIGKYYETLKNLELKVFKLGMLYRKLLNVRRTLCLLRLT